MKTRTLTGHDMQQCPSWMADISEPIMEEIKAKIDDLFSKILAVAPAHPKERGENATDFDCALGGMIGGATQIGLMIIAKVMEQFPQLHPAQAANQCSMMIQNATVLNFISALEVLDQAHAARMRGEKPN